MFMMDGSLLNDDLFMLLLSEWIDFRSIGTLDVAITNRRIRILWLQRLRSVTDENFENWVHSHSSMRWLITRGLRTSRIHIIDESEEDVENDEEEEVDEKSESITDLTFEGLDATNLREIKFESCLLITDTTISIISPESSPLRSIDLGDCRRITDTGLLSL